MEGVTELVTNYGAMGIILGYFIYKDNKTMHEFRETLTQLKEVVLMMKEGRNQ